MSWDICPYKDTCEKRKQGKKCFLGGKGENGKCDGWVYVGDEYDDDKQEKEEEES